MVTAVALISMGVLAVVAFRDGGKSGGMKEFNACITGTRFLVLTRQEHENSFVETIEDRARSAVVGEVTVNRMPPITLGGAAAGNGRYVMSTATPLGRDATAIEGCWDRFFPVAPDA